MLQVLNTLGFAPRSCVWELTLACNMRCQHCGSIAGERRADELTPDELLDVADQLAELGCRRVTLSGGEPTMNPAWDKVARRLSERRVTTNLISNGWSWNERHAGLALDAGMVSVAFSLDGFEDEHDRLRAMPGSYQRVLKAIDSCVAAGLPVSVNTTINRLNQHLLGEMRRFLIERGVFGWQLQFATPAGNMLHHRELVVPAEDFLTMVPLIAELCRQNGPGFFVQPSDDIGYYGQPERELRGRDASLPFWIGCRAGCQVVGIESNGNVKGCLSLPSAKHGEQRFVDGNLRRERLADIWRRSDAFAYNRQFKESDLVGFCGVCRFRDVCRGGCTWTKHSALTADGNELCFYFQAVKQRRFDLIGEEPTAPELAYFGHTSTAAAAATAVTDAPGETRMARIRAALDAHDWREARTLLEQALSEAPRDLTLLDLAGFACFGAGDYPAGERHCRSAIAVDPDHAYAHKGLGLALARQGRLEDGRQALERAIALEPRWFDPYWDLAVVLGEGGHAEQALDVLARGASAVPARANELQSLGAAIRAGRHRQ